MARAPLVAITLLRNSTDVCLTSHFWEVKWGQTECWDSRHFSDLDGDSMEVSFAVFVVAYFQTTAFVVSFDTLVYIVHVSCFWMRTQAWTSLFPGMSCGNVIDQGFFFPHRITLRASNKACSWASESSTASENRNLPFGVLVLEVHLGKFTVHWHQLCFECVSKDTRDLMHPIMPLSACFLSATGLYQESGSYVLNSSTWTLLCSCDKAVA